MPGWFFRVERRSSHETQLSTLDLGFHGVRGLPPAVMASYGVYRSTGHLPWSCRRFNVVQGDRRDAAISGVIASDLRRVLAYRFAT
jgi:hypothetical protein